MRTNIVIEDNLLKEAFKYTDVSTKKDLINHVLTEFIKNQKRLDIREIQGGIKFRNNYDYKKLRKGM
ncbi:MAG: type II toxin-antitoxin system VapB family antitoxin [Actinomycetota bacterium]|nr:MAG: type II toxin-antitoxin system VapB family antitoxin [Actinomycetota bacterium]